MGDKLSSQNKKNIEEHVEKHLDNITKNISEGLKQDLFESRFRQHLATILFSAVGIILAFAWKDFINEAIKGLLNHFINNQNPILSTFLTATIISIICIVVVTIILKWDKKD